MDIIVVEDDVDIAELVAFNLERQGWRCRLVHHGGEGWEQIQRQHPDLVILDVMLPGMDGMQIFRAMKENEMTRGIPAIFLTARGALDDRLEGLSLGADDYVTKPFSPKELVLRVRNVLARANAGAAQLVVRSGPLVLDKNTLAAKLAGEALELTTAEFKLLAYLMERPGKVQDRYELQKVLFGYADTTQSRALDTHVKRLRQKLGAHAACIVTERGSGYYFSPEPQNTDR
ncbi:MAG: response regulator transcription factor [Akkermansia sp.]|nr:response regulator transcription factor [Akkermansia sp.]MBQ8376653.1 response regulator transcription factor [Akkermansia sp.]